MIERASGDGRLGRRLHQISATPRSTASTLLAVAWRPTVVTLIAITAGAMWQRAGGSAAHSMLIGTAVVAILVICSGHTFDRPSVQSERVRQLLRTDRPATTGIDNSLGDESVQYEIRRRPASQITWVSLAKSPVPRY